jgi:hypothetical protein
MKYYVMLRMEGDFPSGYDTLKWEIDEEQYDDLLEDFDSTWYRVY